MTSALPPIAEIRQQNPGQRPRPTLGLTLDQGGDARVKEIEHVVSRFPRHELAIRRLYTRDATFREICADYDDALRALRHWQSAANPTDPRMEQYRELVNELETEILGFLEGSGRRAPD